MTRLCPRCRSIQSVRISTNTTYTTAKKGKNKGDAKKVIITVYHCENCNSYLGSEVMKTPVLKESFDINMPFGNLTKIDDDFLPNTENIIFPKRACPKKNRKRRKNK